MTPAHPARWTVVAVSVLLLASACGDDSGTSGTSSPTPSGTASSSSAALTWADGLCSSVSDWQAAVKQVRSDLADPKNLTATQLQDDVGKVVDSTRTMVTTLQDVPDLTSGTTDAVQQELTALSDRLQQQSDVIDRAVADKPADLPALVQDVSTVTGALATMSSDVRDTAAEIQDTVDAADPTKPFETAPACQELNGS